MCECVSEDLEVVCCDDVVYCLSVSMPYPCVEVLNCEDLEVL